MSSGQIKLDYATMEESSQRIHTDAQSINDALADLASKLDALEWEDAAAEAYQAQRTEWDQSLAKLNELLVQIGTAVDNAKIRYQEVEAANRARFM
ncbi:WXG100 family type VII secretion target [Glycomyces harbinensis]|uniref:ESAT-6-like protein n=1 Tax=Glycomyces harbinensis TaxID=58114 RepID=A0A1G7CSM8_9ACTN|nr:WXG100 family type VII secretion target [Glycomyces harbinensis]SDE42352.1 WXG100 family type VII secretion target [Glycomyces harbinensis]